MSLTFKYFIGAIRSSLKSSSGTPRLVWNRGSAAESI